MEIDPGKLPAVRNLYRSQPTAGAPSAAVSEGAAAAGAAAAAVTPDVQLSERAQLAQMARAALGTVTSPADREERIAALQSDVAAGQYQVPAARLARRLLAAGVLRD